MADDKKQPIIIKKKKGGHAGAHGGAWKIAYADLVTAMMAFFLVMWIIGMDVQTKQGIATYFQNMSARATNEPASPHIIHLKGSPPVNPRIKPPMPRDNNMDAQKAKLAGSQVDSLIESNAQFKRLRENVEVQVGEKETRIEFHDGTGGQSLFVDSGAQLKPEAKKLIEGVAAILSRSRAKISIEGHSESPPQGSGNGQSMWEVSTQRAIAVRGAMANTGIADDRITEVRGLGDTKLRNRQDPINPENRRVVIVMPYDLPE